MNWKTSIQLRDLDPGQRLEVACRDSACGHVWYFIADPAALDAHLYLDELEHGLRCKARGCRAPVRIAMIQDRDASGFVGGLA